MKTYSIKFTEDEIRSVIEPLSNVGRAYVAHSKFVDALRAIEYAARRSQPKNGKSPNVTENERLVLEVLAEYYEHEANCVFFRGIKDEIESERHIVLGVDKIRRACRSLARKGLAECVTGLFDDDGMVAGSGYAATEAGAAVISPCDVCAKLAVYDYTDEKTKQRVLECQQHYHDSPKHQLTLL